MGLEFNVTGVKRSRSTSVFTIVFYIIHIAGMMVFVSFPFSSLKELAALESLRREDDDPPPFLFRVKNYMKCYMFPS